MRTSFHIPDDVVEAFDETWQAEGLESRSRAAREAIQEYTEAHTRLEEASGEIVTVLAFDYTHDVVTTEIYAVQHAFQDVIQTTSHTHQGEWCLETIFCRGQVARIRELVYRLRDFDAVSRVKMMILKGEPDI